MNLPSRSLLLLDKGKKQFNDTQSINLVVDEDCQYVWRADEEIGEYVI